MAGKAVQPSVASRVLFVTGTDTGVGKTIVSASIAQKMRQYGLNIGAIKPYASGIEEGRASYDVMLLGAASGCGATDREMNPAQFQRPLAPLTAMRLEESCYDYDEIVSKTRDFIGKYDYCIVEGIGGVAVPLDEKHLVSDLMRDIGAPVLLVARSGLGTINHSLLTIEHLRAKQIEPAGIVYVRHTDGPLSQAEETSPDVIFEFSAIQNFGIVPYASLVEELNLEGNLQNLPWDCDAVNRICKYWTYC
jgi:dethiobiotin synthetase